jgi:N-acetylglutamate synthase-like GNAT family acetyltransferase
MLLRTPEMISLAIDDYVVVQGPSGEILACGALKEYSPSVAEIAAIAVSRDAPRQGLGRAIVHARRGSRTHARHL